MQGAEILVIDDTGFNRILLEKFLRSAGYRVTQAESGEEALDKLSKKRFDLVVSDLLMPGMDGLSLYKKANSTKFMDDFGEIITPPFILCTACQDKDAIQECIQAGFADVILKPIERNRLLDSVKKSLLGITSQSIDLHLIDEDAQHLKKIAAMANTQSHEVARMVFRVLSEVEYQEDIVCLRDLENYLKFKLTTPNRLANLS